MENDKDLVLITAPINSMSGYGKKAKDFVKSFIELYKEEYRIELVETAWGTNVTLRDEFFDKYIVPYKTETPEIYIHIGLPSEMRSEGNYNILVTSGIEASICTPDYIVNCNVADLIIVPSEFTKNVIELSDFTSPDGERIHITTPIVVLHEGIDCDVFRKKNSTLILPMIKEKECFLFVGQFTNGDRKNVVSLVETFVNNFSGKLNPPALIIKTNMGNMSLVDEYNCKNLIKEIIEESGAKNPPNVYLLHGIMTDDELNNLYNHVKVKAFITLTHGEGFGRPLLEYMMTGKQIIVPRYSGHLDFCENVPDDSYVDMIGGELVKINPSIIVEGGFYKDATWIEVNKDDVAIIMSRAIKSKQTFSEKNIRWLKHNFSIDSMKVKMKEIFNNIEK